MQLRTKLDWFIAYQLRGVPGVWVRHEDSFAGTLGRLALRLADRTVVVGPPSGAERPYEPVLVPPPVLDEPLPRAEAEQVLTDLLSCPPYRRLVALRDDVPIPLPEVGPAP